MNRPITLSMLLMWSSLTLACGSGKVDPPRGDTPPGAQCSSDMQCQNGLSCNDQGTCIYDRCNSAPDPDAWCAQQLVVSAQGATCERGSGTCEIVLGLLGESCPGDEGCVFGLVCEQQQCQDTCTSSASCRGGTESCLPRPTDTTVSTCQSTPSCRDQAEPTRFCEQELGVARGDAVCSDEGVCQAIKYPLGYLCRFDAQCELEICEQGLCAAPCESDESCRQGYVCRRRLGDSEIDVCQLETCLDVDDGDAFCISQLGEIATCSPFGECEAVAMSYGVFVLIEDTSRGGACESELVDVYEPGTDLMYLGAYTEDDDENEVIATAKVHYAEQGMLVRENTLVDYSHLERVLTRDRFNTETGCLKDVTVPEPGAVYSMGCGGRMIVSFEDLMGEPVRLNSSTEVIIGEFEPICTSRGASRSRVEERFTVSICTDTNAVATGADYSSCTLEMSLDAYESLVYAFYDDF